MSKEKNWIYHTFDEVMKGDWLLSIDWKGDGYECPHCGTLYMKKNMVPRFKFCPNCGGSVNQYSIH